jgi:protein KRI1
LSTVEEEYKATHPSNSKLFKISLNEEETNYNDEEDSEDSEDEDLSTDDSEAEFLTPGVDLAVLKTLKKIRERNSSIYESGRDIFAGE